MANNEEGSLFSPPFPCQCLSVSFQLFNKSQSFYCTCVYLRNDQLYRRLGDDV